jgi:hypothetical protein
MTMLTASQLEEHTSEQARIVKEVFGVMADIVAGRQPTHGLPVKNWSPPLSISPSRRRAR